MNLTKFGPRGIRERPHRRWCLAVTKGTPHPRARKASEPATRTRGRQRPVNATRIGRSPKCKASRAGLGPHAETNQKAALWRQERTPITVCDTSATLAILLAPAFIIGRVRTCLGFPPRLLAKITAPMNQMITRDAAPEV